MIGVLLVLGIAAPLPLDRERTIARDLAGLDLTRVQIVHELGGVRILRAGENAPARARLETTAAGQAGAGEDAFLDAVGLEILVEADGSSTLRSRFPPPKTKPPGLSFAAELTVFLPPGSSVRIENRYGPVLVAEREGDVSIRNRLGSIDVQDVAGAVTIEGAFGAIHVRDTKGPVTVEAKTSAVRLERVTGAIRVKTNFREVQIAHARGDAVLENRGAPTILDDLDGNAELLVPYGDVAAHHLTGNLTVQGSHQPVLAEDIGGDLVVRHHLGSVTGRRIGGRVRIGADLTPIELRDVQGRVEVTSPSSPILLAGVRGGAWIEGSFAPIVLEDVGGDVTAIGRDGLLRARWTKLPLREGSSPAISLQTRASPLEIEIPEGASVAIQARALDGSIEGDLAGLERHEAGDVESATLRWKDGAARIEATCEKGAVLLRAASGAAEAGPGTSGSRRPAGGGTSGGQDKNTGERGT